MVGLERSILPAMARAGVPPRRDAPPCSRSSSCSASRRRSPTTAPAACRTAVGRKHVLVAGWLVAVPVPFLLMWAPTWNWVLLANLLLGISQGLTWSTTVIMKIDLVGPKQRGLAMGLNEFAGYVAVAASALATGWMAARYGVRPQPFYLGVVFAVRRTRAVRPPRARDTPSRLTRIRLARDASARWRPDTSRGLLAHDVARRQPVERQPGGTRQQPERRDGLGALPAGVRRGGNEPGAGGAARRGLSGHVGCQPAGDRGAVGSHGTQAAHCLGHVDPGGRHRRGDGRACVRGVCPWCGVARDRHRDGVSRRCSPPSATSPTRRGEPPRSASIASGATSGTRSARCSRVSRQTCSG